MDEFVHFSDYLAFSSVRITTCGIDSGHFVIHIKQNIAGIGTKRIIIITYKHCY